MKNKYVIKIPIAFVILCALIISIYKAIPFIITKLCNNNDLNYDKTGVIGDTIGGTTAPILGSISIVLLCWTLLEQIKFNKTQKKVSDYDMLIKLRDEVSKLSKSICFFTHPEISDIKTEHKSLNSLQELNKSGNFISEEAFNKLVDDITEIIELCLLYVNIEQQSILNKEIKKSIRKHIYQSFDKTYHFLKSCIDNKIKLSHDITSANACPEENKLLEDSTEKIEEPKANERLVELLKEMEALKNRLQIQKLF